jgi:hypothetical protein
MLNKVEGETHLLCARVFDARYISSSGIKFIDTRRYTCFKEIDRYRTSGGKLGYA